MLVLAESHVRAILTTDADGLALAYDASAHAFYSMRAHHDAAAAHTETNAAPATPAAPAGLAPPTAITPERIVLSVPAPSSPAAPAAPAHDDAPAPSHVALFKPCVTADALGLKCVSVCPRNEQRGLPNVPATILLLDRETGLAQCILAATHLTAVRTAAGSAVATDLFARHDASVLAVFGSGLQAAAHVHVVVINRTVERAAALADSLRADTHLSHVHFVALALALDRERVASHVRSAHIVCTCTNASTPVLQSAWVSPGCHINAVGSYRADMQEIDAETVQRAKVVIDDAPAWLSGDLAIPRRAGLIDEQHVRGHLGDFVSHRYRTMPPAAASSASDRARAPVLRSNDNDVTLFKSVGTAAQDIVTAHAVFEQARRTSNAFVSVNLLD